MGKIVSITILFLCLFGDGYSGAIVASRPSWNAKRSGAPFLREENLAVAGVGLSNDFTAEDAIHIVGGLTNAGTTTRNTVVLQFFLGTPGGGIQIGDDVTIPAILPGQTVYDSVSWQGFTGSSHIYFVVDPYDSLPEYNENDNIDSLFVSMRDSVPWTRMEVLGLCHYAASTMIFNLYGAGNTVNETIELAGCPHSFLSVDDRIWFLGGASSLSNNETDFEFAGQIRNLAVDREIMPDLELYLSELRARIDMGLPVETNIDQYYLPQEDYDTLRVSGSHTGHWIVVTGYTDSYFILNDPGVGLPNLGQTPIPDPEKRGSNVVLDLENFSAGIESTSGTRFSLLSYDPVGPMPSREMMLGAALEKSVDRLEGDAAVFDRYWRDEWPPGWVPIFGISSLSVIRDDLNMDIFRPVFDSLLADAGGDLPETLSALNHMCSGMYDALKGWSAAADYYGTLAYPEAGNLRGLFLELVPLGREITDNFYDMLKAIEGAGGDPDVAEPYLADLASDFERVIPLEDSVLVYLRSLLGSVGVNGGEAPPSHPAAYALHQNYPNPFNPSTTIRFDIPEIPGGVQSAKIIVYDIRGRYVTSLIDSDIVPGRYQVVWNGRRADGAAVPSGIYLYTLKIGDRRYTRKMALHK